MKSSLGSLWNINKQLFPFGLLDQLTDNREGWTTQAAL